MHRAVGFLFALCLGAVVWMEPALAEKRVALVIGNSAYQHVAPLPNPINDAADMAAALKTLGFEVIEGINLNHADMLATLRRFSDSLQGADVGLIFYAGHGLDVGGTNYIIPIDAKLARESDLTFEAVKLDLGLEQLEREAKTALVFLDACRDNPMGRTLARSMGTRSVNIGRGLARVETGVGTFIAFATQPGNVALDGKGRNSPFTSALLKRLNESGKDLSALMIGVRNDVIDTTDGKQVPWENSSLRSQFFFKPGEVAAVATPQTPSSPPPAASPVPTPDPTTEAWNAVKDTDSEAILQTFIAKFEPSFHADLARARLDELKKKHEQAAEEARREARRDEARDRSLPMERSRPTRVAPDPEIEVPQAGSGSWLVILGSWPKSQRAKANERLASVRRRGVSARIIDTSDYPNLAGGLIAVVVGPYSKTRAQQTLSSVRKVVGDAYIKSGH